jgi:hypothetical protein
MVEDGYTVKQIMDICGAGETAINRWKKQYITEKRVVLWKVKSPYM